MGQKGQQKPLHEPFLGSETVRLSYTTEQQKKWVSKVFLKPEKNNFWTMSKGVQRKRAFV